VIDAKIIEAEAVHQGAAGRITEQARWDLRITVLE
jgi:hypothetical protein